MTNEKYEYTLIQDNGDRKYSTAFNGVVPENHLEVRESVERLRQVLNKNGNAGLEIKVIAE